MTFQAMGDSYHQSSKILATTTTIGIKMVLATR
jgi:hypothetical protein